ncbi:hypothetical protein ACFL27_21485 [candidate division CSSED10-310 bacterium]|uniref:Uncharacterized protein n=1 Tax=candidate division CSSED10-310 bacterium TaxID=2855610 RepID=A0ABV6Z385_UNCC1
MNKEEVFFNTTDDHTLQTDLMEEDGLPPQYQVMKLQMLFYVAQNHPGWNVLLWPKEKSEYRVKLSGVRLPPDLKSIGRKYKLKNSTFGIFVNVLKAKSEGFPILLTFDGEFEQEFTIEVTKKGGGGQQHLTNVGLGLTNTSTSHSPLIISKDMNLDEAPPIHEGLDTALLNNHEVLIWQTNLNITQSKTIKHEKLPQETIEQLKSLGYAQ